MQYNPCIVSQIPLDYSVMITEQNIKNEGEKDMMGPVEKNEKTVTVVHEVTEKELVVLDKPAVIEKYSKLGYEKYEGEK